MNMSKFVFKLKGWIKGNSVACVYVGIYRLSLCFVINNRKDFISVVLLFCFDKLKGFTILYCDLNALNNANNV